MSGVAETYIVVSLLMAVFAAITALGTSLVLGVGFERLRAGFEVIKKQTGFFSDAIHNLEEKVDHVDKQAALAGASLEKLESKVDIVDKQSSFFSNALHNLEQKVDNLPTDQTGIVSPAVVDHHIHAAGQAEMSQAQAENLLSGGGETIMLQMKGPDGTNRPTDGLMKTVHFH